MLFICIFTVYLFILSQNQFWTQRPQEEFDKTVNDMFPCYKADNLMLYIKYHQLQHHSVLNWEDSSAVQFLKGKKNACKDQIFFLQQIKMLTPMKYPSTLIEFLPILHLTGQQYGISLCSAEVVLTLSGVVSLARQCPESLSV